MEIAIKRVYDKPELSDGYRVLVDKFWPRGIKKVDLPFDEWNKKLAPPDDFRKYFHEDRKDHWDEFSKEYKEWLLKSQDAIDFVKECKSKGINKITLIYSAHDRKMNHALVLKDALEILDTKDCSK